MQKSKIDTAMALAKAHFSMEPDLRRVFLLGPHDDNDLREPIKLLEVVEGTIETDFEPVAFAANPGRGVPYPSLILEISPRQFEEIENRKVLVNGSVWIIDRELHAA